MNFLLILKGFIVGVGKIIPGVSGSMLAMVMGIYDSLIEAITNFFGNIKENTKILFNFCFGLFLAIVFFSKVIMFMLNHFYYGTIYTFLGLIAGTIIPFVKKVELNRKNKLLFLIFLFLMLFMGQFSNNTKYIFDGTFISSLYTIALGGIDALTSIVPGISGTAIFMLLGTYEYVLSILASPFSSLFFLYGVGVVGGIIASCYLMHYLLKKFKKETYSVLFAFAIGSIFLLLKSVIAYISIGYLLLFFLGFGLGIVLDR